MDFSRVDIGVAGLSGASIALGDYDNDDDLDLIVTGNSTGEFNPEPVTLFCENDGNGSFRRVEMALPARYNGSVAWADYDHDGWLDLALAGRVMWNTGDGAFTDAGPGARMTSNGSIAWGDYDQDGWEDLLVSGDFGEVYRNDGGMGFLLIGMSLPAVNDGLALWGDFDKVSRLDILISGGAGFGGRHSEIYRNEGGGQFAWNGAPLLAVEGSSAAFVVSEQGGRFVR